MYRAMISITLPSYEETKTVEYRQKYEKLVKIERQHSDYKLRISEIYIATHIGYTLHERATIMKLESLTKRTFR
jgi:hypothetical protein